MRILYQFPISHYCEKARFCLDHKGLDYRVVNLLPGYHAVRLAPLGGKSVPVLADGDAVLTSSNAIVEHAERVAPDPPLAPPHAPARTLAAHFDDVVGPAVRQWAYGHLLEDVASFRRVFFEAYSPTQRTIGEALAPLMIRGIRRAYGVGPGATGEARARIDEGLRRIEARVGDAPHRPLFGDALSIVDITAAALLAPVVAPTGSPYTANSMPDGIVRLQTELRARPAGAWVGWVYAQRRGGWRLRT